MSKGRAGATFKTKRDQALLDKSKSPSDFSIIVDNTSIPVHKDILRAHSDYFQCMLESGMQEVHNGEVRVTDQEVGVVKTVIDFMYGKQTKIEWKSVTDYVDIVELWQVKELKESLQKYILENIDLHNCMTWVFRTQMFHMEEVNRKATDCFCTNFADIATSSDFLSLTITELKSLLEEKVVLNVSCDVKLGACMSWLLAEESDRKHHLKDLLGQLQLTQCSSAFINLVLKIYKNSLRLYYEEADVQYIMSYIDNVLPAAATTPPAESKLGNVTKGQTLVVLGDTDFEDPRSRNILKVDMERNTVEHVAAMLPAMFQVADPVRCWTPYGMFSCGARSHKSVPCGLLDIHSFNYQRLPDLPDYLSSASATFVNGKVHVLRTETRTVSRHLLYCLDLQSHHWSQCPTERLSVLCTFPCTSFTTCGIAAKLYVHATDRSYNSSNAHIFSYDTESDEWKDVTESPLRTSWNISMVVVDEDIYWVGGTDGQCLKFNTNSNNWIYGPKLMRPSPRFGQCSAVYLDGHIVLIGGFQPQVERCNVNRKTKQWKVSSTELPLLMHCFTIAL